MRVSVAYSGQMKVAAGASRESVEVPDASTAQRLIAQLAEEHGQALRRFLLDETGRLRPTVLAFVNEEQVDWDVARTLHEGDELVFMSAIAGGR